MKKIVTETKVINRQQPTPLRELIRQQSEAMRAIHNMPDIVSVIERQSARCQ
ncbi:hypothetical protein [Erythrobacter westpacificensis]|uniref:hypothetical protein n=1 Tax=Erythrobacter westpacificensis TaxID=1055231 RepID=UPI0031F805EF